jgi:hypothetical protein
MNAMVGWALAVLAVVIGYAQWGWQGALLAVTVIAFWLLLQFSRALRVLRNAGQAPVGHVESAVMLHAKLHAGQRLPQVLAFTKSLGLKLADDPETFEWRDAGGDAVRLELVDGKLARWQLLRTNPEPPAAE